jgi:hypothetical protein
MQPDILQEAEKRQNRILDADYRKVEVDPFVKELKHLTMDEKQILGNTLKKLPTLFGGGLGMLNIKHVKFELIDGAKPYHARPFPVPQSLEETKITEMKRLTDIDVFNRSSDSEWAAPTFIQAQKTGDVRILTDFRRLNAQIRRKPFPLPKISDLLSKLSGIKYETVIDLSAKLLPLPQPPVRARADAQTNPSAQRATQLRSVLARVYAVSIQNQITTTVPLL